MKSIKNSCVLVRCTVGKQSSSVRDDGLGYGIDAAHHSDRRTLVHKKIFKNSQRFKKVQSAYTGVYQYYVNNSLPWDNGSRIIPSHRVVDFMGEINQKKVTAQTALDEFINNYHQEVAEDMASAGNLLQSNDYPTPEQVRSRFYTGVSLSPVPGADDFRVIEGLDEADVENLISDARNEEQKRCEDAVKECWHRLYKVVNHMCDRLSEYGKGEKDRLHKSIVTNVTETVDVLRRLNITGDQALDDVLNEIQSELDSVDIEKFKAFKDEREQTVSKMNEIMSRMGFFQGVTDNNAQ